MQGKSFRELAPEMIAAILKAASGPPSPEYQAESANLTTEEKIERVVSKTWVCGDLRKVEL